MASFFGKDPEKRDARVLDFLGNLRDNKLAYGTFRDTMHATLSRNKLLRHPSTLKAISHFRTVSNLNDSPDATVELLKEAPPRKKGHSISLWRGCLNPKEYFQKYIKESNRDHMEQLKNHRTE
jgi:hypothetical protein